MNVSLGGSGGRYGTSEWMDWRTDEYSKGDYEWESGIIGGIHHTRLRVLPIGRVVRSWAWRHVRLNGGGIVMYKVSHGLCCRSPLLLI